MNSISSLIIPILVLGILIYGIYKKVNVYDTFIEGAVESFDMIIKIFPNLLAMILGVNILLNSNVLNILEYIFSPLLKLIEVPFEIVPMSLLRPISGTSSLVILNDLFTKYGADSFIGTLGSIIQGSTDTTFYVLTLYFGSVGIKKIRYGLIVGLLADLIGIITSVFIVKLLF